MTVDRRRPSSNMYLLAREHVATRLVAAGKLDPLDALALVVWPTVDVELAERHVLYGTLTNRAFATRNNP